MTIANKWVEESYLQDLRTNRPARPTGARPAPAHFNTWSSRTNSRMADSPVVSPLQRTFTDPVVEPDVRPSTSHEPKSHTQTTSIDEVVKGIGRPLVHPPRGRDTSRSSMTRSRTPSVQYRENEQRVAEQDEARAVRLAMEELDMAREEKLFEAARDEAVELVWKHCNPHAQSMGPNAPYAYPGLTRKGSAQRSRSVEPKDQDLQRMNSKLRKRHSMGSAVSGSRSSSLQSNGPGNGVETPAKSNAASSTDTSKGYFNIPTKTDEPTALAKAISDLPDLKQRRRSSGPRRTTSGSLFQNPNDQIYEEPEEEHPVAPAPTPASAEPPKSEKLPLGMRRNPFMRFQSIKGNPMTRSNTDPILATKKFDRYEIQKNPPSQSRNAAYTLNTDQAKAPEDKKPNAENEPEVKMKEGKELRSDELRAATGFRLKDRSPKLPTPTAVSDAPGRPIVSFKKDWNVVELKEEASILPDHLPRALDQPSPGPRPLTKSATAPVIPTVNRPNEPGKRNPAPVSISTPESKYSPSIPAPSSRFSRQEKPVINVYEDPPVRPLPTVHPLRKVQPGQTNSSTAPTLNVYPPASLRSKTAPGPAVPTISISETPSFSTDGPSSRNPHVKVPSIGITPPIPSISINESPAAPRRSGNVNVPTISVMPDVPTISINDAPTLTRGNKYEVPSISVSPSIPSISINDSSAPARPPKFNAPSISITPSVPAINVSGPSGFGPAASTRPLPTPGRHMPKSHSYNGAAAPRSHWTPTTVRTGALCNQCALPIAGRIVSAAGCRFHPECFACYQCGEHLECVAFYPEPSNKLAERVNRIRARLAGQDIAFLPTHPTPKDMARLEHDDGTDEAQRFFCHLDFHELFSPRCKSCKTPIEGEVIVACGAEWHAGHFFCAQCGDPFDSTTPFVEKDGYAWCVNCHTHRYSTKCKGCRKPVTDTVVKALGAEWHMGCFCCVVSCSSEYPA